MKSFSAFIPIYLTDFELNSFLPNYTIQHNMFKRSYPETLSNSMEKIQITKYPSLYSRLKDFFDIMMGKIMKLLEIKHGNMFNIHFYIFYLRNFTTFAHYNVKKTPFLLNDNITIDVNFLYRNYVVKVARILELNRNNIWPRVSSCWEYLYLVCLGCR